MKDTCYLVINKRGIQKMYKNAPPHLVGEIAVKLNLNIPDKAFEPARFEGTISIDKDSVKESIYELEFELKRLKEVK
jgi:hypothetical protein